MWVRGKKKSMKTTSSVTKTKGNALRHISPTYKKAKREVCFLEKGSAEVKSWGKYQRASASLDSFSVATIPDVAHTPQSDSFSAWEHRPAGPARHQRPAPKAFLFFFFFFFYFPGQPIIRIVLVHMIVWRILRYYCAKPSICVLCVAVSAFMP